MKSSLYEIDFILQWKSSIVKLFAGGISEIDRIDIPPRIESGAIELYSALP